MRTFKAFCLATKKIVLDKFMYDLVVLSYCAAGELFQSIEHPGKVLKIKFLGNGDLLTICSDNMVRIWSTNADPLEFSDLSQNSGKLGTPDSNYFAFILKCVI